MNEFHEWGICEGGFEADKGEGLLVRGAPACLPAATPTSGAEATAARLSAGKTFPFIHIFRFLRRPFLLPLLSSREELSRNANALRQQKERKFKVFP